jgi:hypothetical protein
VVEGNAFDGVLDGFAYASLEFGLFVPRYGCGIVVVACAMSFSPAHLGVVLREIKIQ